MPALEVENRVSLHRAEHAAHWSIKGDEGKITLNLPKCYNDAIDIIGRIGISGPDDDIVIFIGVIVFLYLEERICIERAHEKIRLRRDKCHPCIVQSIAEKMLEAII